MLHTDDEIIELHTADSIRKKENLSLEEWAKRFNTFLAYLKIIYTPSLIVIERGISKKYEDLKQHLTTDIKVKAAKFRNNVGIIGSSMYASKKV